PFEPDQLLRNRIDTAKVEEQPAVQVSVCERLLNFGERCGRKHLRLLSEFGMPTRPWAARRTYPRATATPLLRPHATLHAIRIRRRHGRHSVHAPRRRNFPATVPEAPAGVMHKRCTPPDPFRRPG